MSAEGSPRTNLGLALVEPLVREYRAFLSELGPDGRRNLWELVRKDPSWVDDQWCSDHWRKHWGGDRTPAEYGAWAIEIVRRPGVEVWAFVHLNRRKPSLAFIDHDEGAVVWMDLETLRIVSAFRPIGGTRRFLEGKDIDYWRLKEAEL